MTTEGLTALASLLEKNYQHRHFRVDGELLSLWAAHLQEYDDTIVMRGVIAYTAHSPHPPTIADLLREIRGDPRDAERLLAEEAEAELLRFEREFCDYEVVDYGPIPNAVVRALGVDLIATWMARDEWKFHRDEWRNVYKALRRRADGSGPPIPANVTENVQKGYPIPVPRLAIFMPSPIPGLPGLPGRLSLPSEVKVDGKNPGSELAVPPYREGGDAE